MLFSLNSAGSNRTTHAGVLEFVAEPGRVYLPHWMMENLLLSEGDIITVTNINNLQVCTYSKFQPMSEDFLEISNPKAVLENTLRNFACLTAGDIIAISYLDRVYRISVLEVKPTSGSGAVSIIECDMQLDFAPPVGYVEPDYKALKAEEDAKKQREAREQAKAARTQVDALLAQRKRFGSGGARLDGKASKTDEPLPESVAQLLETRLRAHEFQPFVFGKLEFARPDVEASEDAAGGSGFASFTGEGRSIREKKKTTKK